MSTRSWRAALAALACLLPALALATVETACRPDISVHASPVTFRTVDGSDVRGVTALNQTSTNALTRQGYGLGSTFARASVTATWHQRLDGCPALALQVAYPVMDVYVASELRQNACAYEHVYAHEMEHVAIYRRWMGQLPARLQALFAQRWESLRPLPAQARVEAAIELAMAEMRQVRPQHDAFDSHEEYRTNSTACGGFIPQLLARLKQEGRLP